jgi:hypothetical protein
MFKITRMNNKMAIFLRMIAYCIIDTFSQCVKTKPVVILLVRVSGQDLGKEKQQASADH